VVTADRALRLQCARQAEGQRRAPMHLISWRGWYEYRWQYQLTLGVPKREYQAWRMYSPGLK
jgi:hypothetical protein